MSENLPERGLNWFGIFRLILSSFLFLYSLLTLIPLWWDEGLLYNLAAIEDGSLYCFLSLIIFILPAKHYFKYSSFIRWIPFLAFILLLYPAFQSAIVFSKMEHSGVTGAQNAFSYARWIKGYKPAVRFENLKITASDNQTLEGIFYSKNYQTGKHPLILVLHGGGFTAGTAQHGQRLAAALADRGWKTLSIDYRLAPQTSYPGQVEDVKQWIQKLKIDANHFEIDTTAIFLAGESAGATIAVNAAYTLHDPSILAVANLYGIVSTEFTYDALLESSSDLKSMINAYRGTASTTEISPIVQCRKFAVPTISIHGERDPIIPFQQAAFLAQTLDSMKIQNQLLLIPWATHLFNHPASGPSGQLAIESIDRFFRQQTKNNF